MPKPAVKRTKKTQPADKSPVESEMVPPQRKLRIVSLFSGAGGLEIAACRTGKVEAIVSTDSNATFLSTVEMNMPTHFPEVLHSGVVADARELSGATLKTLIGSTPDIVMGGPPCDDYTKFGKRRGFDGEKGPMIFEFLRIIEELNPDCFVFENVPNLVQQFKCVFDQFINRICAMNYYPKWDLLKACDFGAPTQRSRVFVVGWKSERISQNFNFPEPGYGETRENDLFLGADRKMLPFRLISDVLESLPNVDTLQAAQYLNHTGRRHKPSTVEHFKTIPMGKWFKQSFRYRVPWAGLSQSLTAGTDDNTKTYIHPHYHREMSVREYARIHLFPDSWNFSGTPDNGNKQVANSVPVPLGEAVLEVVFQNLLSKKS
jgi:DNA (cytosine-5)-methyltransferase 1